MCKRAGKGHILSILDWQKEDRKKDKLDNLGKTIKDSSIKAEDQLEDVMKTFKEINDDDKSDKSIMQAEDSEADYELIEEQKSKLEDKIQVYME